MLDVEVVVLHIREDHAGEPELAFELSLFFVAAKKCGVFRHDPVALSANGVDGTIQVFARLHLVDVVPDELEGHLEVLDPDLVVMVEARARREVEPRLG